MGRGNVGKCGENPCCHLPPRGHHDAPGVFHGSQPGGQPCTHTPARGQAAGRAASVSQQAELPGWGSETGLTWPWVPAAPGGLHFTAASGERAACAVGWLWWGWGGLGQLEQHRLPQGRRVSSCTSARALLAALPGAVGAGRRRGPRSPGGGWRGEDGPQDCSRSPKRERSGGVCGGRFHPEECERAWTPSNILVFCTGVS